MSLVTTLVLIAGIENFRKFLENFCANMWIVRGIALGGHAYSDEVMDKHLEQRSADWVFFK